MMTGVGTVEMQSRVFHLAKAGHRDSEYEDGFALSCPGTFPYRAAMADGATESAFARIWAETLVSAWVASGVVDERAFVRALPEWQQRWMAQVTSKADNLPWYAAAKVEEGAFATFLGLSIDREGTWQALAVGDCCLFHFREDGVTSWPLDAPEAFTSTPALVPSLPDRMAADIRVLSGAWNERDALVLATDAAAAWLMRVGPETALGLTPEDFPGRIARAREDGNLRNDDVTIIVLRMSRSVEHERLTTNNE